MQGGGLVRRDCRSLVRDYHGLDLGGGCGGGDSKRSNRDVFGRKDSLMDMKWSVGEKGTQMGLISFPAE